MKTPDDGMRKYAAVTAGVLLSVILGATLFSTPVTWAAQIVSAEIIGPLDNAGRVRVHEAGTANVNVTNTQLRVAQAPVTGGGGRRVVRDEPFDLPTPATASAISLRMNDMTTGLTLSYEGETTAQFAGPAFPAFGNSSVVLGLARPITFDRLTCGELSPGQSPLCSFSWVGSEP